MVTNAGINGSWQEGTGKYTFRSKQGGILHWWESNNTVQFQGRGDVEQLRKAVMDTSSERVEISSNKEKTGQQIFIVHGHDTEARDQLELALRRLGLEPYILMNTSGGGKTIIEALEGKIGKDFSSDFGIVLLTPDDMGYSIKEGKEKEEPRARQNVILETGMLLSSLTRERIALVVKGHVELPSDLQGIIHYGYNNHVNEIMPKLCRRFQEAGYSLDSEKIMHFA
ncbi:MAG: nucleotide-binding protein [Candidatus Brocadiaceae bacterium]|nr:nucleotide-binding protein [Candidatus Brocadiaceae bacterium]